MESGIGPVGIASIDRILLRDRNIISLHYDYLPEKLFLDRLSSVSRDRFATPSPIFPAIIAVKAYYLI